MTFGDFKELVAAYAQRDASSFVVGTTDVLASAINLARRWAEQRRNFNKSKVTALLQNVSVESGKLLSEAVVLGTEGLETPTSVDIKYIHKAYFPITGQAVVQYYPIEVVSREACVETLQRKQLGSTTTFKPADLVVGRYPVDTVTLGTWRVYQWEQKLWIYPADTTALGATTIDVALDVTRWMPDYEDDEDTDFFLTDCQNFMLMRSLMQLNLYLKEDSRVQISAKEMQDAWIALRLWDDGLISTTTHENDLS